MCGCVNMTFLLLWNSYRQNEKTTETTKKVSEGSEGVQHLFFGQISSYHLFKCNTFNLIEQDILTERRHKCNILSLCESSSVTERERNANKNTYFSVSFSHAQTTQRKRSMATVICTKYHPCSSTTLLMTDSSCQVIDT